ncbi:MAG: hypothetical protein R2771_05520 [Saprospiraceae bacterium]
MYINMEDFCFVDYACSAPYVDIDMKGEMMTRDSMLFFLPHKFLGGPSTSGILIFDRKLYHNAIPDTQRLVLLTGQVEEELKYHDDIEARRWRYTSISSDY